MVGARTPNIVNNLLSGFFPAVSRSDWLEMDPSNTAGTEARGTSHFPASQSVLSGFENEGSTNTSAQLQSATAPPDSDQNSQFLSFSHRLDTRRLAQGHTYTRDTLAVERTSGSKEQETARHEETNLNAVLRKLELFERRFLHLEAENRGLKEQVTALEKRLSSMHKITSKFSEEFEPEEVNSRLVRLEADSFRLTEELKASGNFSERALVERKDPKMEPPPEFSGKQADFSLFSTRLAAFLAAQPHTYSDDLSKVMYTASRLTGVAAEWFQSYLDKHSEEPLHWGDFRSEFGIAFKDPLIKQRAQSELLNLAQMQFESFEDYLLRFRRIRAQSQFPDEAVVQHFRHGLHYSIKTTLLDSTDYDPADLESTISKARQVAMRQLLLSAERGRPRAGANVGQRPTVRKWCTLHNTSSHSSEECKVLLARRTEGEKSKQVGKA